MSLCWQQVKILWKNRLIQIDGKEIYYNNNWSEKDIHFMKDIINEQGELLTKQELKAKFNVSFKPLQYESLVHAIPAKWKKILRENGQKNNSYDNYYYCAIFINQGFKKLSGLKTKDIYWHLASKISQRPTSETTWQKYFNPPLTEELWHLIYTMTNGITFDSKLINFQFKITHRIIACGYQLKKWKINESDICPICHRIQLSVSLF